MKQAFIDKRFTADTTATLVQAIEIVEEYEAQGYSLTVRQLYYQMVSRDYIPNNIRSYKRMAKLISNARLAGHIDWNMIEDRGRVPHMLSSWIDPVDIVRTMADSFRIDKWKDQDWHVIVMVEKDALSGVLQGVCDDMQIELHANKGYSSQSAMYRVGQDIGWKVSEGKNVKVIYLGDHDPSGLDMDRDIVERLSMFSGRYIHVDRLALTYEQIEEHQPPENPAKTTDSRARVYIQEFGYSSWELDALSPDLLTALVREGVLSVRDEDEWSNALEREREMREELESFAENYNGS